MSSPISIEVNSMNLNFPPIVWGYDGQHWSKKGCTPKNGDCKEIGCMQTCDLKATQKSAGGGLNFDFGRTPFTPRSVKLITPSYWGLSAVDVLNNVRIAQDVVKLSELPNHSTYHYMLSDYSDVGDNSRHSGFIFDEGPESKDFLVSYLYFIAPELMKALTWSATTCLTNSILESVHFQNQTSSQLGEHGFFRKIPWCDEMQSAVWQWSGLSFNIRVVIRPNSCEVGFTTLCTPPEFVRARVVDKPTYENARYFMRRGNIHNY